MFSIQIVKRMFYLILLLQHCNYMLQDCTATEMNMILKDAAIVTSTVSPIFKHLLKTNVSDSDAKVSENISKTEMINEDPQDHSYRTHKNMEINQKLKYLRKNFTINVLDVKQNDNNEDLASINDTSALSTLAYLKRPRALKTRLHEMIVKMFTKFSIKSNSSEFDSDITSESNDSRAAYVSYNSDKIFKGMQRISSKEKGAIGRQFVFHPYLPYGKDVTSDEKISIGDVLPLKMLKFFKGMVEDAPWEQMFMKMVRMIVDQFVDKIIEKMFALKDDDHDEWRSSDEGAAPRSLPRSVLTYATRPRRSVEGRAKSVHLHDGIEKDLSSANRVSKEDRPKTKEPIDEESWLDSILDYLFPDDPKASGEDRRKRRDAKQPSRGGDNQIFGIMRSLLARYTKLRPGQLSPEGANAIVRDPVRHKASEIVSQSSDNHEKSRFSVAVSSVAGASSDPGMADSVGAPTRSSLRTKRSSDGDEEEDRLWQANRRPRPSNRKSREDCSLRRACNAGRLLSRLPSVHDITVQLKTHGNEPHWDALLWGMTKKRCSRIFCKRQRSPKGSKHHWGGPEERFLRKSTPSSGRSSSSYDLTTI